MSSQSKPFELHYRGNDIRKEWEDQGEVVAYLAWSDLRMPIVKVDERSISPYLAQIPKNRIGKWMRAIS